MDPATLAALEAALIAAAEAAPQVIATWSGHADDKAAIADLLDKLRASMSEHDADAADLAARERKP